MFFSSGNEIKKSWKIRKTWKPDDHQRCSIKKGVLKNFAIFNFPRPATLLKRHFSSQVFSCETCKIFNNTYFEEHLLTAASENRYDEETLKKLLSHFVSFTTLKAETWNANSFTLLMAIVTLNYVLLCLLNHCKIRLTCSN